MFVLLYGTAIYNAPNAGSILLQGEPYSCFLDFSSEYADCQEEIEDLVEQQEALGAAPAYLSTMSPFLSPRTPSRTPRPQRNENYGTGHIELKKKHSFA